MGPRWFGNLDGRCLGKLPLWQRVTTAKTQSLSRGTILGEDGYGVHLIKPVWGGGGNKMAPCGAEGQVEVELLTCQRQFHL